MRKFPFIKQSDAMDCGATCLGMVVKYHGKTFSQQKLRDMCYTSREGVSMLTLSDAAEKIGLHSMGARISFEELANEAVLPCIVHWNQDHFVVVYDIKFRGKRKKKIDEVNENDEKKTSSTLSISSVSSISSASSVSSISSASSVSSISSASSVSSVSSASSDFPSGSKGIVKVADPGHGLIDYTIEEFCAHWISTRQEGNEKGIALLLEPTPAFYEQEDEKSDHSKWSFMFRYLKPYKKYIIQLFLGMLLGSLLQLIFPFLTQGIVDYGISNQNLSFVTLILIAQLVLFASQTVVEFIRSWILLHITSRVNISMISDFLAKLMRLPIRFFDSKLIGDLLQRIHDNSRIQNFLTSNTISTLFSFVNMIIFSIVLGIYSLKILGIFLLASALYVFWIVIFLKKRKELDYKRFAQASAEQSNLYQLITGMQEIKLQNCEKQKRWEWESIQAKLFKLSIKGLALNQYQQAGGFFINETKNIVISFFAASAVISGDMTLGMMMAVQYIIGQLNAPIAQLIGFVQSAQDAKISIDRLNEIHGKEDEENPDETKIDLLPEEKSIHIQHLFFRYDDPNSDWVLDDINLHIPQGKVTAIVGMSGSGKTTLVKLMLGFYPPEKGSIQVSDYQLPNISNTLWRDRCGAVMQDGFIFSDTIAKNIAVSDEIINKERLLQAVKTANILDFVESLPLGFNTKIGQEGHGLSQGQKQRILIARVVYKNPDFIFFDEATNALDANNELVIMENLEKFFHGRTVVVVAHRLSTVKNADNIVVLDKGQIVEQGTHAELTTLKGAYYELVKNQLELGN